MAASLLIKALFALVIVQCTFTLCKAGHWLEAAAIIVSMAAIARKW